MEVCRLDDNDDNSVDVVVGWDCLCCLIEEVSDVVADDCESDMLLVVVVDRDVERNVVVAVVVRGDEEREE